MTPALNKPVPEFEALATGGTKFTPQAYAGKIVVLYFYPKDNTPGCTTEAMQFRDHYKDFLKAGAVLFGVSRDNMASHDRFAAGCLPRRDRRRAFVFRYRFVECRRHEALVGSPVAGRSHRL